MSLIVEFLTHVTNSLVLSVFTLFSLNVKNVRMRIHTLLLLNAYLTF